MPHPQPKWIRFEKLPRIYKQVTDRWLVVTLSGEPLGIVKWYSPWRQYSFCPQPATVFERTCLRDIATFCENETADKPKKLAEVMEVR